ncbi:unnamed protein product [Urochloa humidicola]
MKMPMLQLERNAAQLHPEFLELPVYWTPSHEYRLLSAFPALLHLSNNNFSGTIPTEIGQMKMLVYLNFSSNSLSGEIPQEICNLTSLQVLDFSNNQLTGALPPTMTDLHFLSTFNVSCNKLEGPIPTGGQFDTFSNSSYIGNPNLCGGVISKQCGTAPKDRTSSSQQHSSRLPIVFGVIFGGLSALALIACFLIARLVYNDHTESIVLLQRR